MTVDELDTPAVLIDIDRMERNLSRMAEYCALHGLKLRPHTKTHKIPELAQLQMKYGASGISVAKTAEAEVMADGGIGDVLIVYPIVGNQKCERLIHLAQRIKCAVALDSLEVASGISAAARRAGVKIGVRAEFDTGFRRCGLPIHENSLPIVQAIRNLPGLIWEGIVTYPGQIMANAAEREQLLAKENDQLARLMQLLKREDIGCPVVSGGNTPSAYLSHRFVAVNEIRPGTYIFNDKNTVCAESARVQDCAVSVLATVVSTSVAGKAMIDAGSKTLSGDYLLSGDRQGFGYVVEDPAITIADLSEEHGHLDVRNSCIPLRVGSRVRIIPNHACTCINMHDLIFGVRGNEVLTRWPVAGRGKVQ